MTCYFCGADVTDEAHCFGCGENVCEDCEANWSLMGSHDVSEHREEPGEDES